MTQQAARPLKVGLILPAMEDFMAGGTARWTDLKAMAQLAEAAGFDSLWVNDHLLYDFGEPDGATHGNWECLSLLAALAGATNRVELGTLVVCTSFRNPALLAKMADTIDEISGGRLILGLGAGWHEPEYRAFGYPFDHRVGRFEEAVRIIRGLLREGTIDFHGQYYDATACELRPRGPRPSGPPILIGAKPGRPRMLRLAAQYADDWNIFAINRPGDIAAAREAVDAACRKAGRDPATLRRTVGMMIDLPGFNRDSNPAWVQRLRTSAGRPATGTPEQLADLLRAYARAGVGHVQVLLDPNTMAGIEAFAHVLPLLDRA